MRRKTLLLLSLILLCLSTYSHAQTVIDASRRIDWSNAGVPGGIPNRTTVCAILNPGATAAQINSAIANCPSGQVVFLNAGTYNLSAQLIFNNKSNVTLRGAGADQTKLIFTAGGGCRSGNTANICLTNAESNWVGGPTHTANWIGGYAKGTTQIALDSTTGLAVGNILILDQLNDSSDTGGIFVCDSTACSSEGPTQGQRTNRSQLQIVKVTAINGNVVTISPGLYMSNWRSSQSPGAWWGNSTIKNSGVEDLSIDNTSSGAQSGIMINNGLNCWVKGVRSLSPFRVHVWVYITAQTIVRDSYFYGTQAAASQSYGIETYPASDILVENNIFQHIAAPIMLDSASSGTVVAYNHMIDNYYSVSPTWLTSAMWHHAGGLDMVLWEGNDAQSLTADQIHGTHHFATISRNLFYGDPAKSSNTALVHLFAYSRYFNIIGNVLGRAGYYDTYESTLSTNNTAIYSLGDPDGGGSATVPDLVTISTLLRWGNYDTVTGTVRFLASEVPSGLSQFANPVPASQTLPASFYLSARPAWWTTPWGTPPWPPIGPDVSNGNITGLGGHANKIPARLCYENTPKDINGILLFSANNCSRNTTSPLTPTNLRVQ